MYENENSLISLKGQSPFLSGWALTILNFTSLKRKFELPTYSNIRSSRNDPLQLLLHLLSQETWAMQQNMQ